MGPLEATFYHFSLYFWKRLGHADVKNQEILRGFSDYYTPLNVRMHTEL